MMNGRRIVIPDVHGCAETLRELLGHNLRVRPHDAVYLLGDLIDRGPRSKEVLDYVLELGRQGISVTCLRGNHEQMLLDAVESSEATTLWLVNGGHATLDSFQIHRPSEIPFRYMSFISGFPFFVQMDDAILVHAGLNHTIQDPLADTQAMLWDRPFRSDKPLVNGKRVICGHTPAKREKIRRDLAANWISLDNGCVFKHQPEYGALAALELNTMELIFQPNRD